MKQSDKYRWTSVFIGFVIGLTAGWLTILFLLYLTSEYIKFNWVQVEEQPLPELTE